jgi:hypothetical protein
MGYILKSDGTILEKKKKEDEDKKVLTIKPFTYSDNNSGNTFIKEDSFERKKSKSDSYFDDGYQFGDITKTVLKTGGNVATNLAHGAVKGLENFYDFTENASSNINTRLNEFLGIQTKEEAANERAKAQEIIKRDLTTEAENALGWDEELRQQWEKGSLVKRDNLGGQVTQAIGEMMPTLIVGNAMGGLPSNATKMQKLISAIPTTATMGTGAYGGALEEAYNEGATTSQANKYALGSALTEVVTEWLTGGVPGVNDAGILDNLEEKTLKNVSNNLARFIIKEGYNVVGEGAEEALSEIINPYLKNATYSQGNKVNWNDVLQSALVGGITGGVLDLPGNISTYKNNISLQQQNQANLNENTENNINIPTNENVSENGLNVPTNTNANTEINLPSVNTTENVNSLENLQEFNQRQQEIKNQQVAEEQNENINKRLNTLEEQLEKQGSRILEESISQREAMIEHFKEYLEENNITNPTQKDIDNSITDNLSYDNELDMADTIKAEKLYNQYVKEYMQENGIPFNNGDNIKQQQFDIIQKSNPMQDDYHTGIRSVEDIKTLEETLNDSDYIDYDEFNPDLTRQDIENAIKKGTITVYSSYPIENGVFVSPSRMEAESYSGNGKVYSKEVPISSVAWIDPTQGQIAIIPNIPTARDFNKINLPTNQNNENVDRTSTFSKNLLTFTDKEKFGITRDSNNVIVESKNELQKYVLEALNNNQSNKNLYLGVVPKSTINKIINEVTDISAENKANLFDESKEYQLAVNQEEIRHLHKESLTENDVVNFIDSLDELIANFDKVRYTTYKQQQKALRFIKNMNDGTHIAVEILSKQKGTMRTHTLFLDKADFIANKKRSISPSFDELNNSPNNTSEMDRGLTPSVNNDSINSKKSQISLPTEYNMQQKEKKIPTKQDLKSNNKVSMPMAKNDDVLKIESKRIADQINKTGGFDLKQRSWIETSTESDALKGKVFIEDLDPGKINYVVQSNKKSLDKANNHLNTYGYEKSLEYVNNLIQNDGLPKASDVALMQRMIQEASKRGDVETVQNLIMDTAILGTDLGQATQALSMIKKLTPEGQLTMYTKLVERAKARGEKSFQNVEITPEMVQNILEAYDKNGNYDQDDLNARVEQFKQDLANQMKSTAGDKIDAWRYLSMLGNPKTHIRNMVSNIAMTGTIKVKNAMARTLETILPVQNRTKTWKKASNDIKEFSRETAINMKDIITGENKYNEKSSIESKKQIFKNKVLEKLSNFNGNALEGEDWFFSKRAFQNTLEEYLTANGINTYEDIENNPEIIEKAKSYAVEQAEIATFRQYSKLASMINQIEKKNKGAKLAVQALMPFKKTPINVAKAGVSYSPLGLIKSMSYDLYQLKQGNIEASQFIDNLSQGLTGTSLTLLGYALAKAGILTGSGGDDKDDKYDKQLGNTGYSLNIGGNSYSISWLSPVAMPLLVGSNAYEQLEEQKEWDMNVVSDTLAKTLDPLNEMSFMQGLTNALQSYGSGTDKIKGALESTGQNYVGQFFPTIFSQFAATIDDKKRSTKASNNSSYKFGEQTIRSIMYKIPGLRQKLEVATDIWGNEKEQSSNILERAFESFLAPYSKTKDISTDLDKEIKRVYSETGESGVIPSVPYAYVRYKNETYRMSANEYTDYKKTYGQNANKYLNNLINSSSYKSASDEMKAKMIDNIYDYAKAEANEQYFKNTDVNYMNDELKELEALRENGINSNSLANYVADKTQISSIQGDKSLSSSEKKNKALNIFTNSNLNNDQLSYLYSKYYSTEEKVRAINNINIPMKEFIKYDLQDFESDYNVRNGKAINNSKKAKVINYINNNLKLTAAQKALLIKMEYNTFKGYDSQVVNYVKSSNAPFIDKAYLLKRAGFNNFDKEIINYVQNHYSTAKEKEAVLKNMGFTVRNGRVYK